MGNLTGNDHVQWLRNVKITEGIPAITSIFFVAGKTPQMMYQKDFSPLKPHYAYLYLK